MRSEESAPRGQVPDRLYMEAPGLTAYETRIVALDAVTQARLMAPKMTGTSASRFEALYGPGFFGIRWQDPYVWYQEVGIHPFTMRKLAGKTIPMWIDDPTGEEQKKNPRARTRTTASGKVQVLIFRRAARHGQRKQVRRSGVMVDVPASYPGAPGRIAYREARRGLTTPGRVGGQIARYNIGVRWRHPGLSPRSFLYRGMVQASYMHGLEVGPVHATNIRWR